MRLRLTRVIPALVAVAATVALLPQSASAATAAADPVGPEQISFLPAKLYSSVVPTALPPGTNDWTCRPSAAHPRPVVLVHGTWANRYDSFAMIAPQLKRAGYCVYALNYGDENVSVLGQLPGLFATAPVKQSGAEIATFVNQVLGSTGASQVDMFGWSQGGVAARTYLKYNGGANPANPAANKVKNLVMFGATNHGTTLSGLGALAGQIAPGAIPPLLGPAAMDQLVGSPFLTDLNAGGDTFPGITYTVIGSKYDEVSTPYQRTFLTAGPGAVVKNITLQSGCEIDFSDHLSGLYSYRLVGLVKKALDPSHYVYVPCLPHAPVL